jgi:hypothetical protein
MTKRNQKTWPFWAKYEHRRDKLAPRTVFIKRIGVSLAVAFCLILAALSIGVAGYRYIAGFGWIDSLLEASMILGGMGPVNPLTNNAARIFASVYALFSGVIFIALMGIMLSPVVHRVLHKFHVDEKDVN